MPKCECGDSNDTGRCSACRRRYYELHRERERATNRIWIENNKEHVKEKAKQWREQNKSRISLMRDDFRKKYPLFAVWKSMMDRCYRPSCKAYENYGGRGISVCERWRGSDGYKRFSADVPPRPTPEHSIERIDNNGNYEMSNVRWATRAEQQRNRRNNVLITVNGRTQCLMDWSIESGINYKTLQKRFRNRFSEQTFLLPPDPQYRTSGNRRKKV